MEFENTATLKQPKGLYLLSFTAIWERFSYYGTRAFLILYMANDIFKHGNEKAFLGGLGFEAGIANIIYGLFNASCYILPLFGGYIADRYIGKRKSVVVGGFLIMIGHFTLATDMGRLTFFIGLTILAVGNGFFKPTCSSMIGDLYKQGDPRRDSAFTLYYMLFNGGAFAAPIVCGFFAEEYAYKYGFLIAGIGMMIGLIVYMITAKKYLGNIGVIPSHKEHRENNPEKKPLTKVEKDRLSVIFVLWFFVTFFWMGFELAGGAINLYTDKFINKVVFGWEIPTSWFQSINPIFILILGLPISRLWIMLSKRGKNPSTPVKMGLGLIVLAVGFVFMVFAALQIGDSTDSTIKASMIWVILMYLFHTVGELFLSPIGLSMVTKLSPVKLASLMMGVWFTSTFAAHVIGGFATMFIEKFGALTIFASIAIFVSLLGVIVLFISRWLLGMMHGRD